MLFTCKIKILAAKVTLFGDVLQPQTKGFSSDHTRTSEVLFKTDYSFLSPAKRILKAWPSLNQFFYPPARTGTMTEAAPNSCLCHRSIVTFMYLETFLIHHSPFFHKGWQWENAGDQQHAKRFPLSQDSSHLWHEHSETRSVRTMEVTE